MANKDESGPSLSKAIDCMEKNHGVIVAATNVASNEEGLTFDSAVVRRVYAGIVFGEQSGHLNRILQAGSDLKLVEASNEKGKSLTVSHKTKGGGINQIEFIPPKYGSSEKPILHSVQNFDGAGKTHTMILDQALQ